MEQYVEIIQQMTGGAMDPSQPHVDGGGPSGWCHEVRIRAGMLRDAFRGARRHPGIGQKRWDAWVCVRFYLTTLGRAARFVADDDQNEPSDTTVSRWLQKVDTAVDRELSRRDLLASDRQIEEAKQHGVYDG